MRDHFNGVRAGYIEVYVFGNGTGDIINSNGFNIHQLLEMQEQMQEPEQFEGLRRGIYAFKIKYSKPQKDNMGRVEVEGYWEFEEDEYSKSKFIDLSEGE